MWVCTNYGFFSIVKVDPRYSKTGDNSIDEVFTVRSRVKSHLEQAFENKKIYQYSNSDYEFRVYLTLIELNEFLLNEINSIDYLNFKNSVKDPILHKFFSNIWVLGVNLLYKKL